MNCHDFDERIQQLLDDRLPVSADGQLRAHAVACPGCDETLAAYAALLRGSKQLKLPALDAGFAARVVAKVQNEPVGTLAGGGSSPRVRWLAPLAAIAALVLLAVGLGTWANWNQPDGVVTDAAGSQGAKAPAGVVGIAVPGPVAKSRTADPAPRQVVVAPQLPVVGGHAASPYLASNAHGYDDYRLAIQSLTMQLPGAVGQFESVETYAPGIRPIRESFSTAFETLLNTLPGRADTSEPQPPQASSVVDGAAGLA